MHERESLAGVVDANGFTKKPDSPWGSHHPQPAFDRRLRLLLYRVPPSSGGSQLHRESLGTGDVDLSECPTTKFVIGRRSVCGNDRGFPVTANARGLGGHHEWLGLLDSALPDLTSWPK